MAKKAKPTENVTTAPTMLPVEVNGVAFFDMQWDGGSIRLGVVPLDRLVKRRENYKAMNERQLKALRANLDRFGFKGFVVVTANVDGSFGMVDGHHRWDEAKRRKMSGLPALLVDNNADELDLGMLGFNVVGDMLPGEFYRFALELSGRVGEELVFEAAALDDKYIEDLQKANEAVVLLESELEEGPPRELGEGTSRKVTLPSFRLVAVQKSTGRLLGARAVASGFVVTQKMERRAAEAGLELWLLKEPRGVAALDADVLSWIDAMENGDE